MTQEAGIDLSLGFGPPAPPAPPPPPLIGAGPGQVKDPYLGYRFAIEISGIEQASFNECTGLQVQTEVFEYKEGGLNTHTHKLPGRVSYSNITLKWGTAESGDLWDWYYRVITRRDTSKEKVPVSIIQYDAQGREVRRWNLSRAYPVKWVGPNFNAAQSAMGIESLELAYAEFEVRTTRV